MNIFRVQFMMERLVPNSMTGSYDEAYLNNLTTVGSSKHSMMVEADKVRW